MSPILDLEPQLPTVFRLRLGEKSARGPKHLAGRLRATSAVRAIVEDIAANYQGSDVEPWASPDGPQWETKIPTPLRVGILPGQGLSQWWERWGAGGCTHRCDGTREMIEARPCQCPPMPARMTDRNDRGGPKWCQPYTRLTVLLPRLRTMAAGRLDSTGQIAARGLAGSLSVAQGKLDSGLVVAATLAVRVKGTGAKQYVWPELVLSHDSELEWGPRPALPSGESVS